MRHPEEYVMSRDEWLEINRVLAGCSLALRMPGSAHEKEKRQDRLKAIEYAKTIMSEIYQRSAKKETDHHACGGDGMKDETYLGDGLYASFDGFSVWLRAPREDGDHMVALEPAVFDALVQFHNGLKGSACHD